MFPYSGRLLGMLAECEQRGHTLSRLRLHLTKRCQQTSAALLWLMAIKAEAVLPAGSHRVQVQPTVLCPAVLWFTVLCCALLCPTLLLFISHAFESQSVLFWALDRIGCFCSAVRPLTFLKAHSSDEGPTVICIILYFSYSLHTS